MKTQSSQKLAEILATGVDVHRCAAARALGEIGLPMAVKPLVAGLLDEDEDVRVDAATALGGMKVPSTAAKLMDNLIGDPEGGVKMAVIKALVAMKYMPVVPILIKLVTSRTEDEIAWDQEAFYTDGWDDWDDVQVAAIEGLGELGVEDAVGTIVEAMNDEEGQDLGAVGLRALARLGEAGAHAVIDQYGAGNARECRQVARAVGQSDNPHLDALRVGMVTDENPEIRELALRNIDKNDPSLGLIFADKDPKVRASVVTHAGLENRELLEQLIIDPSAVVRIEVFKIITANPSLFKSDDTVKSIQTAIKGEPQAAKQAALALIAIKGPKVAKGLVHVLDKPEVPREFRIGVVEALAAAGDVGVEALLKLAADEDRQMRLASLTALSQVAASSKEWPNAAGDGLLLALEGKLVLPPEEEIEPEEEPQEAVPLDAAEIAEIEQEIADSFPLVAEMEEPTEEPVIDVASKPLSTLDAIKANKSVAPIEAPKEVVLAQDTARMLDLTKVKKFAKRKVTWETAVAPYLDVQQFSARLLGSVVNKDVTAALVSVLTNDRDEKTVEAAMFALAKHGQNASLSAGSLPSSLLAPLQELLTSEASQTRVLATRVIGWLEDGTIQGVLEGLLDNDDQLVRVEAIQALDHRGTVGAGVIAALDDKYLGAGIAAARALARHYGDEAVDSLVLYALTNDGIYRRDIGKLLGEYAPDAGAKRLLALLNDESEKSRWLVAIDALAELFQHKPEFATLKVA